MENNFSHNTHDSEVEGLDAYGSDPNAPASSVYVDDFGNVGIGTTTPTNLLDVGGNALIGGNAAVNGSLTISKTNGGSFSVVAGPNKIPVANQSGYLDASWGVIPPGTIYIDKSGQVGITTETPKAKLDVETNVEIVGQDAIHAVANTNGVAITAVTNNNFAAVLQNNGPQPTLNVTNNGNGNAAVLQNKSTQSTLSVTNNGDGNVAVLQNNSTHATLSVTNNGNGIVAALLSNSTEPTLNICNNGTGNGIYACAAVDSAAGLANTSTTQPALWAENLSPNGWMAATFLNQGPQYPALWAQNTGVGPAAMLDNASTTNATVSIVNSASSSTNPQVAISTVGLIKTYNGTATFTQLPAKNNSHCYATSPLTLEIEIQFSGSAQLIAGTAHIEFSEHADLLYHSEEYPYKVLLTPTDACNGLMVAEKKDTGFTVKELNSGDSNTSFDWLIIARKSSVNENNEKIPQPIPASLAECTSIPRADISTCRR